MRYSSLMDLGMSSRYEKGNETEMIEVEELNETIARYYRE